MQINKQFTAIKVETTNIDSEIKLDLSYGYETGPYYDRQYPPDTFPTEGQAIEYAYKTDKRSKWLILPIISFDNIT